MNSHDNNPSSSSSSSLPRRDLLSMAGLTAGAGLAGLGAAGSASAAEASAPGEKRFMLGLNTSTIRGQNLDAAEEIEIAGKAGYEAIEPWFRKLNDYVKKGGSLKDLKKRIDGHGLKVTSAIGFAPWIVNDDTKRAAGFEEAKRDMDLIAQLGGLRIAAPPAGVGRGEVIDLDDAADRYRKLLELGDTMGVVPQAEMWGGNPTVGTVEKALYVAIRAGHPKACFLGDAFHTYKGGCSFDSFRLLGPNAIQTFHMNDYPADPPRERIKDEHRVFPGDGVAPLTQLLRNFKSVGAYPVLSLELFNREYWKMDALECARLGLEKMKAVVAAAD